MSGEPRAPGWYPDRNDPESNRYWNGRAWTARRLPVGVTPPPSVEERALPEEKQATGRAAAGTPTPKQRIPVWMWIVGGLMVARSIAGVMAAFDGSDAGAATVATHPVPDSSVSAPQTPHS